MGMLFANLRKKADCLHPLSNPLLLLLLPKKRPILTGRRPGMFALKVIELGGGPQAVFGDRGFWGEF